MRVKHKPLLCSALQDEQRSACEEQQAGEAGGVQRNPLQAEEAERVDEDAHGELAGDEETDGGEGSDPRCDSRNLNAGRFSSGRWSSYG